MTRVQEFKAAPGIGLEASHNSGDGLPPTRNLTEAPMIEPRLGRRGHSLGRSEQPI